MADRIARVEAIPVSYPEPNDFNALRHLCLVKITTDDGVVGWGESITQFPEANFAVKAIIEGMAERVVGKDPLENVRDLALAARQEVVVRLRRRHRQLRRRGHRHGPLGHQGQAAGHERAQPPGRRGPREAAGRRLLPRPLRGHRPDGRGGPGVGRARAPRRQGRLRQARRRAPGLRARPGRGVHAPDARGPGPGQADHDRLRLERQVGRDRPPSGASRRSRSTGCTGSRSRSAPGTPRATPTCAARPPRLIAYGEKEWDLDGFERILDTGTVDVVGIDPGRAEGITGLQAGRRADRVLPAAGERPCLVERHLLRGQPGHQLQLARRPSCSSSSRCATRCSTTS